jgi:hypothetical protein
MGHSRGKTEGKWAFFLAKGRYIPFLVTYLLTIPGTFSLIAPVANNGNNVQYFC